MRVPPSSNNQNLYDMKEGLEYRTMDILYQRLYLNNREINDWAVIDNNGKIIVLVHDYMRKIYIVMEAHLGRTQGIRTHQFGRFRSEENAKESFREIAESYGVEFQTLCAI